MIFTMPYSDGDLAEPLAAPASGRSRPLHDFPALEGTASRLDMPEQRSVTAPIPDYLEKYYWWAYVRPGAVRFFERQWLIELILLRNYKALAKAVFDDVGTSTEAAVLQVACAYGDFTPNLVRKIRDAGSQLDVVDVLPIQLENLSRKLAPDDPVLLWQMDSRELKFAENSFDCVLLFFLMHEQPDVVRRQTLAEAHRVLRPGGRLIIVDYAKPSGWNVFRLPLRLILPRLEPFFLDLWTEDLGNWMPSLLVSKIAARETFFGGLYQTIIVTK